MTLVCIIGVFWLKYSIRLGIWIAIRVSVARKNCARLFVWFSWLPESMSCRKCRRNHAAWSWLCRKQAARRLLWRRSQAVRRWLWRSQAARRLLWRRSQARRWLWRKSQAARRWWWRRSQARRLLWRSQAMFRVGLQLDQRHNLWVAFLAHICLNVQELSMNSSAVTYAAIVLGHAVVSAIYTSTTNNALFVDIIFVGGAWANITTFDVGAADSNADIICSSGQILSLPGGKCYIRPLQFLRRYSCNQKSTSVRSVNKWGHQFMIVVLELTVDDITSDACSQISRKSK